MNHHSPLHSHRTLPEADCAAFTQESIDLFSRKRQGHLIHRMYMTDASLRHWSELMKHDGYYVTRSELSLIQQYAPAVSLLAQHPDGIIGIENGPGAESTLINKSAVFFGAMKGLHTYVGRDLSPAIIRNIPAVLTDYLPDVRIVPDLANFQRDDVPQDLGKGRKVMAEFGITRGNMEGFATDPFPSHVLAADMAFQRTQLDAGDLYVLTFDANQDKAGVEYAYSSEWLTQWGRELFRAMERELPIEGDFDPEGFDFVPVFHAENHISTNNMVATADMAFTIAGKPIRIHRGDAFAITNSYKIPLELFRTIALQSGFDIVNLYQAPERHMTMSVLRAA